MMTAWFLPGASLLALLIVDVCCLPVKKGFNPSLSQSNNNAGPESGVYREPVVLVGSSSSSSGPAVYGGGSLHPGAALQPNSGVGVGGGPAVYVGSTSSSGPALYGHGSLHSGAALNSRDMNWAVAPPSTFSGGEGRPALALGAGSSGTASVSPQIFPPPPPAYQGGELAQLEESFEHGDYERETEDQGVYPPSPMQASVAGQVHTSQPQPGAIMGPTYPGPVYPGHYPHYDYRFVTGQYPPGTYTDLSMSFEQGMDNWEDAHYRKHYPVQVAEAVVVQKFEDPRPVVKAPYGKGQQNQGKGYGY